MGSRSSASEATRDPLIRLAWAAVRQAVDDLREADPVLALNSLCWWICDWDGPTWLDLLGLGSGDPDRTFRRLLEGSHEKKRKADRCAAA